MALEKKEEEAPLSLSLSLSLFPLEALCLFPSISLIISWRGFPLGLPDFS
jgi:hypothetical protein